MHLTNASKVGNGVTVVCEKGRASESQPFVVEGKYESLMDSQSFLPQRIMKIIKGAIHY